MGNYNFQLRSAALGFGDKKGSIKFEKIPIDNKIIMVSVGSYNTLALDNNGILFVCSSNYYNKLCIDDAGEKTLKFERVENVNNIRILMNMSLSRKYGSNTKGAHNHRDY